METPTDMDSLPYELHTNRELEFMLHRGKPLAHFLDEFPAEPCEEIIPEESFAVHVDSGVFVRREFVELGSLAAVGGDAENRGIRHVFFARPAEDWRIDEYISMLFTAAEGGWSEDLERLQGSLLGYEEWQTDIHLERLRRSVHAQNFPWLKPPGA